MTRNPLASVFYCCITNSRKLSCLTQLYGLMDFMGQKSQVLGSSLIRLLSRCSLACDLIGGFGLPAKLIGRWQNSVLWACRTDMFSSWRLFLLEADRLQSFFQTNMRTSISLGMFPSILMESYQMQSNQDSDYPIMFTSLPTFKGNQGK